MMSLMRSSSVCPVRSVMGAVAFAYQASVWLVLAFDFRLLFLCYLGQNRLDLRSLAIPQWFTVSKKNRRGCRRFWEDQDALFRYVQNSLPPQALENQK